MPVPVIYRREFTANLNPGSMQQVHSFGIGFNGACKNGCCPPLVSLVLGVNGEIDVPVVLSMDQAQAESMIERLVTAIADARKLGTN
jgi:hypothetical protein